jgi:hypothetical protein
MNTKQRAAIARKAAYAIWGFEDRAASAIRHAITAWLVFPMLNYADRTDPVYLEGPPKVKEFDIDLSQYPLFPKWPGYPGFDRTTHEQ